ncbi:hypothetical protein [Thiobacillus sp.]|uniref:hypothetical protein n=1 Tax=Thiobacillus sp. TaxID=924 RepID=UPI00286E07EC|nr:hypothetical protein [Thiobacillus sp.]
MSGSLGGRAKSGQGAWLKLLLVLIPGLLLAVLLGLVSSTGSYFLIGILSGLLLTVGVAMFPRLLLWTTIVGGMVVSGAVALYLPQFQFVSWLVAGSSGLLMLYVGREFFRLNANQAVKSYTPNLIHLALLFLLLVLVSTLINQATLGTTISGVKGYFQIWPLMFALALIRWDEKTMLAVPKVMMWVALIQLPFVFHQYWVLVPERVGVGFGIVPVDVVAGTFGAEKMGGGANATLAIFMILVWTVLLAEWKYKRITGLRFGLLSPVLLTPLFLNESKLAVLYIAIVFLVLFKEDLQKRFHVFVVGSVTVSLVIFALLTSYVAIHADEGNVTMDSYIQETIDQNFSDKRTTRWSYELNRSSVYGFWAEKHGLEDPLHSFIGHGLAQSRASSGVIKVSNLATNQYQFMGIGQVSASALLWDVGLFGFLLVMGMFWWAWQATKELSRYFQDQPEMFALFRGLQAIVPGLVISLAHKDLFLVALPTQTLILGLLGYIAYWQRNINERR